MTKGAFLFGLGGLLAIGGITLWALNQPLYAAIVSFAGFFICTGSLGKGTTKGRILILIFAATALGFVVSAKESYHIMAIAMFFLSFTMGVRSLFLEKMNYTDHKWVEVVLYLSGMACYVTGNLYEPNGWMSWAFPAPLAFYASFMMMSNAKASKQLKSKRIDRFAVEIGRPAPEISLPDENGANVNLSDFRGKRHVLLIFVRGDWCPTCHIMLRSYEKNKEKFAEKNIMLLAVGPDDISVNREMVNKLNLDYKLLSDNKLEAVKAYGMQTVSNNAMTKYAEGIPLPASFLIDIKGNVQYTSNPQVAGQILSPETIIPVIDKLHVAA